MELIFLISILDFPAETFVFDHNCRTSLLLRQSFYFLNHIETSTFNLDKNDIIVSYCNDVIVGSRHYNGIHTDVPAMGHNNDNPEYCDENIIPNFKVYDYETDRLIEMHSEDIPNWSNLGINNISLIEVSSGHTPISSDIINVYPNPFNPSTKIEFSLSSASEVSLEIFDINGNSVGNLVNNYMNAGTHHIVYDGSNVSSGIYYYTLKALNKVQTKKMTLIK